MDPKPISVPTGTMSDYDYPLPREQVAQRPAGSRDGSRLMVLERSGGLLHARFSDLGAFLTPGDVLVLNDTKVMKCRLEARRAGGGRIEILLTRIGSGGLCKALVRPGGRLKPGETLRVEEVVEATLLERREGEGWTLRFPAGFDAGALCESRGGVPLPPYIHRERQARRDPDDLARYQTVYAAVSGAVAAPTAGLHFSDGLLDGLRAAGIRIATVTLHVGPGTFLPVKTKDPAAHRMHPEEYRLDAAAARTIEEAREEGGRCVAVGTTACRTLEACRDEGGRGPVPGAGWTSLFIRPPHEFGVVDALVTNFHLPRSTLLLLVAAFAGRERILEAYRVAIEKGYRFYSYGDAMLIL